MEEGTNLLDIPLSSDEPQTYILIEISMETISPDFDASFDPAYDAEQPYTFISRQKRKKREIPGTRKGLTKILSLNAVLPIHLTNARRSARHLSVSS